MLIKSHHINDIKIAEVISEGLLIHSAQDGLDLMGDVYYQGFDKVIIYEKNITPDFFDLKTKMAGDILQKFSNYRIALAIVGDFSKYESKSLKDFIFESNKTKHINFVAMLEEALENFSK
ncbi:DUF4180 domain-containing protein [Chryseobacterium lactis]|uniref:DUF4180 domain-containing protein n=1 Tax=Chryseobacterium lactis TaxID=1241981 RepID=A0A3G6RSB3_CHRLC|nr:DUF4180 domain-containing protein [Chryseobacterium lactis]AZA83974.1 DUF4180 domain-containing protein [Chryseobacterium lactis]AZB04360.1 DUF4180 domain-containing protein [Chryseobacterium lactis]PNW12531.1 DUF4180 domain-containing protein [Chryseobacterium lactis]